MPDPGVRLQLLIGPTVPLPAPYAVMDALIELQVTNRDQQRDGFQITFSIGKETPMDYGLLLSGLLDPPNRVIIMVFVGFTSQVLIDGIITNQQIIPSNRPGDSRLIITGEDISIQLDLVERSTTFPNQPDSIIVTRLIANYATFGLIPLVTPTTDVPIEVDRVPLQQSTDLRFIQELAERNGFVFYIEPTPVPGTNTAYFGVDNRLGAPQPVLRVNSGADTNVDSPINFRFDALGPVSPQVTIVDPTTKISIPIPLPASLRPPLASRPTTAMRQTLPRDTSNLDPAQAALTGLSAASDTSDAVTGSGEVDSVRYGRALQSRKLVGVGGAGATYDGFYYVSEVTHRIKRGEYKQNFTIKREGRGALTPVVVP